LDVVAADFAPGQTCGDRPAKQHDVYRPTHPACGTIPPEHATQQDSRGFPWAIKSLQHA
jgi:hypothetical protein